jgi:hypothetical protein
MAGCSDDCLPPKTPVPPTARADRDAEFATVIVVDGEVDVPDQLVMIGDGQSSGVCADPIDQIPVELQIPVPISITPIRSGAEVLVHAPIGKMIGVFSNQRSQCDHGSLTD